MRTGNRILGDRYELLLPLASGGMGRVWRARDTVLRRPVAVKILRSEFTGDPTFLARFRAEAQHAAVLTHPNIASVFDYGELVDEGEHLAYLVMELVEGEPLSALLAREGRLGVDRTLSIVRQTAAALAAAHAAGVIHRDVKPGNVLMGTDGTVKITDFGIASSASSVPLTQTGQVVGTAHYLSPEQAEGAKASPASDVYALGTVAYECLAGRRAFEGENSVQIVLKQIREEPDPLPDDVPVAVRRLVERAMAKNPAVRFPDGAAVRDAVDEVGAGRGLGAIGRTDTAVLPRPPAGAATALLPAGDPPPGRRRILAAAVALLAVLAAAAVAVALFSGDPTTPPTGTTTTTPATATTAPALIDLDTGDYVGRPVDVVEAELRERGLAVDRAPEERTDVPAGQVTALDPVEGLAEGGVVTVSYAVAPVATPAPPPPAEDTKDEDQGGKEDQDQKDEDKKGDGDQGGGNGRGDGGKKDD